MNDDERDYEEEKANKRLLDEPEDEICECGSATCDYFDQVEANLGCGGYEGMGGDPMCEMYPEEEDKRWGYAR